MTGTAKQSFFQEDGPFHEDSLDGFAACAPQA
jgi:hypothetical protein